MWDDFTFGWVTDERKVSRLTCYTLKLRLIRQVKGLITCSWVNYVVVFHNDKDSDNWDTKPFVEITRRKVKGTKQTSFVKMFLLLVSKLYPKQVTTFHFIDQVWPPILMVHHIPSLLDFTSLNIPSLNYLQNITQVWTLH